MNGVWKGEGVGRALNGEYPANCNLRKNLYSVLVILWTYHYYTVVEGQNKDLQYALAHDVKYLLVHGPADRHLNAR